MRGNRVTRWLLACGVIGPVLFVVGFLIEEAIRPEPNNVFRGQYRPQGQESCSELAAKTCYRQVTGSDGTDRTCDQSAQLC